MMNYTFDRKDLAIKRALKSMIASALSFKNGLQYGIRYSKMSLTAISHGYLKKMGRTIDPRQKYT
jgi:hypothetical protein